MSWLSEQEIVRFINRNADRETLDAFQGVFSMDALPTAVTRYPFLMIVNTQARNTPGEHWISVFIGKDRRGEIFDSLALPVSNVLIRWMNIFSHSFVWNRLQYQHPLSARCGIYALFYVLKRLRNSKCITESFNASLIDNEKYVIAFYRMLK